MSKRIQVVLSNDESEKLDKLAMNCGRSLSNMARRLIIDGMKPKDCNMVIKPDDLLLTIKK